jgi:hypothetical protein
MNHQDAFKTVTVSLEQLHRALEVGRNEIIERQLQITATFHRYSFNNVMLIAKQFPNATLVAGFHAWKTRGRWVKAGEQGIAILAPIVNRREREICSQDAQPSNLSEESVMGFRIVYVFDISQTDGEPIAEHPPILGNPGRNLDALVRVFEVLSIRVEFVNLPGNVQGYSLGGEVRIQRELDDASLFRVMVHELAHELLHRTIRPTRENQPLLETEAEAVGFVVASACGVLCLERSANYIALHQGDTTLLAESLCKIQKTSSKIIGLIESQVSAMDEQPAQSGHAA